MPYVILKAYKVLLEKDEIIVYANSAGEARYKFGKENNIKEWMQLKIKRAKEYDKTEIKNEPK